MFCGAQYILSYRHDVFSIPTSARHRPDIRAIANQARIEGAELFQPPAEG